jgi:type II secretory pathway pseudopilin PulG
LLKGCYLKTIFAKIRFHLGESSDEAKEQRGAQAMKIAGKKNSAITFFEVTVLISIIVVLAALLMPALNRSRDQAKATLCANNMRQLLVGRQSYIAENDGGRFRQ